ncbi:hypothetical protein KVH02_35840, partial [Streptomyces olivaceus]|nr:hypothetical protein [Streptomyces olivaceus]MBZ6100673.1 hypothetical protein [Streptomyces olivaceus]MBZ6121771.1 hypothetical protein [Streptomyces olivaceus]MBZ6156464.1 hypothetical protein [Streptomyces olivaceus]MBZ6303066.1 hypothetical protein [Streptomyces olivaceus]
MPTTTMLDQATAMIENAWGQPIEALEVLGRVSSRDHQRQRFELPPEHGRGMVLSSPALITKVGHVTAGS